MYLGFGVKKSSKEGEKSEWSEISNIFFKHLFQVEIIFHLGCALVIFKHFFPYWIKKFYV